MQTTKVGVKVEDKDKKWKRTDRSIRQKYKRRKRTLRIRTSLYNDIEDRQERTLIKKVNDENVRNKKHTERKESYKYKN